MLTNLKSQVKSFFRPRVRTKEIKELIATQGRSQKWLAAKLGITPEYFNNVIHGRYGIRLNPQSVPALAEALGVAPKEITRLFGLRNNSSSLGDDGFEPPTSCL